MAELSDDDTTKCSLCGTEFNRFAVSCPKCHSNLAYYQMLKAAEILERKAEELMVRTDISLPSNPVLLAEDIYRTIAKALRGEE